MAIQITYKKVSAQQINVDAECGDRSESSFILCLNGETGLFYEFAGFGSSLTLPPTRSLPKLKKEIREAAIAYFS